MAYFGSYDLPFASVSVMGNSSMTGGVVHLLLGLTFDSYSKLPFTFLRKASYNRSSFYSQLFTTGSMRTKSSLLSLKFLNLVLP